jgi:hypothetical protein
MDADPPLPLVFTAAQARQRGFTDSKIRRRVARRTWRTLRRGIYCLAIRWDAAPPAQRHRMEVVAAYLAIDGRPVVSHASAAVFHGLPMPFDDWGAWLTRELDRPTRYLDGVVAEVAALPADHVEVRSGMRVTTLARTVADCLRHLDDVDAVVVGDAAVRRVPQLLAAVVKVLEQCGEWPYAARAIRRLPLLDGRRESPSESWSYVAIHRQGLPMPEPQVTVGDERGRPIGRVDGWWATFAAIGEVDGAVKYGIGTDLDPDKARRALLLEKQREDALRRTQATVIRWGTADLRDEHRWAADVRRQLADAQPERFRGTILRPVRRAS